MCFSASASFGASAVLAIAGIASVTKVRAPREYVLAGFPLIFSVQQFCEGMIWLDFSQCSAEVDPTSQGTWVLIFLFLANAVWPVLAPVAALLLERSRLRRMALLMTCVLGVIVFANNAWGLLEHGGFASPRRQGIHYSSESFIPVLADLFYLPAVCALCLSSSAWIALLGFGILMSNIWAAVIFSETFASTWCFFAALLSGLIVMHLYLNNSPTNAEQV